MKKLLLVVVSFLALLGIMAMPVKAEEVAPQEPTPEVVEPTPNEEEKPVVPEEETPVNPVEPTPDEDKFEVSETIRNLINWVYEHLNELKATAYTFAGTLGAAVLAMLGRLIYLIVMAIKANRKEEKETAMQKAAYDKIIEVGENVLNDVKQMQAENNKQLIDYINTLDNNKRKEAIEANAAIQDSLSDIINGVKLDK